MDHYLPRLVDRRLTDLLDRFPAVSVIGPRACGKTTTARRVVRDVVRLDRPADAVAFRSDPDVALASTRHPVLLDEWQEVPEVLGAVKRAVDDQKGPGRFVLTGSVRAELDVSTWPGTGRLVRLAMTTLSMRELTHRTDGTAFLDRLAVGGLHELPPVDPMNLADYVDAAIRGGFPDPALTLDGADRLDWIDSYLEQLITRDAPGTGASRDPERLRRFLQVQALNTAGQPTDVTIAGAIGVDRRTVSAYQRLLVNLGIAEELPAWTSNRLSRLVRAPKRYLTDPSLVTGALRIGDTPSVLRDGDLLGRLLDTLVMAQLRAELAIAQSRPRLHHARERGGTHEVDIVVEYGAHRVAAIEVKSTAAPRRSDARHLDWLRASLADRFVCGVVLHTGPARIQFDDSLWALPMSALWA